VAEQAPPAVGEFDRDTAVSLQEESDGAGGAPERVYAAEVSPNWRAGRGPHGGYLAAMLMRALSETVADPVRAPRSLTVHFPRAPEPGPVTIATTIERAGRSLSTLSARMEQDGRLIALALSAFSVPWSGPEVSEVEMPHVAAPDPGRFRGNQLGEQGPPFGRHITVQPRIGGAPFADPAQAMETGAWLGLADPRPVDALSVAFFSDALIPVPFMRESQPNPAPTIDLTVHFRTALPRAPTPARPEPDPEELCLVHIRGRLIHEGFFEEDGTIWAADGTLLAQSRQLAILLPS
jgi:acyl-CoA thioesterase